MPGPHFEDVTVANGAEAFLAQINANPDVDYIFANTGTDHGPILEALAKMHRSESKGAEIIVVPHEQAAVSMAHGYYCASGKPQVVLVHTLPGTANGLGGLMNAKACQVPMLFVAGRTPVTEGEVPGGKSRHIHWRQESRDQGSIVREFVKWDYENRANEQLGAIIPRAFKIAMAEPRGPVYLSLPREWLYESMETTRVSADVFKPPSKYQTPVGDLQEAAEILMGAANPVILTRYLGKTPAAVKPLVELADLLAIPVVQHPQSPYMNFPSSHPCHAGHDIDAHIKRADVVFLIDIDVPWTPANRDKLLPEAVVLQLEIDPLFSAIPVWGFPVDHAMTGSSDVTLPVLNGLIRQGLDGSDALRKAVEERRARVKAAHDQTRAELAARIEKVKGERPIHPLWVSQCIADVMDEKTIVVGEAVTSPLGPVLGLERPASFFDQAPAGHLGWGMGAAIGAKLAAPDHTVIAAEGDGSYMFCVPTACHFTAQKYQIPFLTVIYNNQAWNATLSTVRELYPDGVAHQTRNFPGTDLTPSPQFEMIAQACGAHAERVDDPEELPAALARGLKAVKEDGRQALVNVICRNPAG